MPHFIVYFRTRETVDTFGYRELDAPSETEAYARALGMGPSHTVRSELVEGVSEVMQVQEQA